MAVKYVRVDVGPPPFQPVVRPTGNVAIVGASTKGTASVPLQVTSPADAAAKFGDEPVGATAGSALTRSINLAFRQAPGPSQMWGVPTPTSGDVGPALTAVENLDVQFVVVADTPLDATSGAATGAIGKLVKHVGDVSDIDGDGKERMGVAMLKKGADDPTVITSTLASDRMVYVAHNSNQDAAAAVAGTIAGYEPHISMLLKPVNIDSDDFAAAQIDKLNGKTEDASSGPTGAGVIWLVNPTLIAGPGMFLGEGYTGKANGKKYIDVQRMVDFVAFKLKARLIGSIGQLRVTRADLRSLIVLIEAELDPLVNDDMIVGYAIVIELLTLLDADPSTLTKSQLQQIQDAETKRVIEILLGIDYAGAIHRIPIKLKFE
jgi:hypothetical protein